MAENHPRLAKREGALGGIEGIRGAESVGGIGGRGSVWHDAGASRLRGVLEPTQRVQLVLVFEESVLPPETSIQSQPRITDP